MGFVSHSSTPTSALSLSPHNSASVARVAVQCPTSESAPQSQEITPLHPHIGGNNPYEPHRNPTRLSTLVSGKGKPMSRKGKGPGRPWVGRIVPFEAVSPPLHVPVTVIYGNGPQMELHMAQRRCATGPVVSHHEGGATSEVDRAGSAS